MNLCGIPYFYSSEFEEIYFSMIDFLYVDKEIEIKTVSFEKKAIYIQSFYTNWTEKDGLIDTSLFILLDYGEDQIQRDILGYEVKIDFFFQINGEVKKDEVYRKRFKNLDDVEDYNNWLEFRSYVSPWLVRFKMYSEN